MQQPEIITIPEGKIRDYIDGTLRKDTPEEHVRQTVEKRLVLEHHYPKEQIAVEFKVKMGSGNKRADIVVFPSNTTPEQRKDQHQALVIIECKNEKVKPSDSSDGIAQLKTYMASCSNCRYGMWTNGVHKTVLRKVLTPQGIDYEECNDIPSADGSSIDSERPKRTTLTRSVDDNLLFTFRTCHDTIYISEGLHKEAAFFEFLKIIFCKIQDERNVLNPVEFYTTAKERLTPAGQQAVYQRVSNIFNQVKADPKNRLIFAPDDTIDLSAPTVAKIVAELQKYSLLNTDIDYKGKAYEEIVGSNLRGDRGEFFTPRNVMQMAVAMLNPTKDETVADTSCGTGGFVVSAMNHVVAHLTAQFSAENGPKEDWPPHVRQAFNDAISRIASSNYFGLELNPALVKATKMNMVMNNDGSGNIVQINSLLPPSQWSDDRKAILRRANPDATFVDHNHIGLFHCIVTNPPFGYNIPIEDRAIIEQFDLGHIWESDLKGHWLMTSRLRSSVPPEQLFLERIIQFLRPGGRAAVVLPDSILSAPGLEWLRVWLMQKTRIVASIDLHADTFQPHNGTQCSILFFEKKTETEMVQEQLHGQPEHDVFMAMVEHVGHDKRGNTTYLRDPEGNLILQERTEEVREVHPDGTATYRTETYQDKIIHDQTALLPPIFENWKKEQGILW